MFRIAFEDAEFKRAPTTEAAKVTGRMFKSVLKSVRVVDTRVLR